tara:strand:- start:166 stop:1221 length:1056 start_codon:yes stop_codon:yes gene_type:complete
MKKSELKNIIKESIKGLMTKQLLNEQFTGVCPNPNGMAPQYNVVSYQCDIKICDPQPGEFSSVVSDFKMAIGGQMPVAGQHFYMARLMTNGSNPPWNYYWNQALGQGLTPVGFPCNGNGSCGGVIWKVVSVNPAPYTCIQSTNPNTNMCEVSGCGSVPVGSVPSGFGDPPSTTYNGCVSTDSGNDERGCMDSTALNYMSCCPGNNYPGCVPNIPNNEECCEYEGRGTEDKGCMDPNALNNGECCNGDPNCTAIYPNPECCRYEDDPVEEIYCECCKGQYAQSMAQTVSSPADCIGAENTMYAGMGVYGCNVSPVSGGPGTQCKKPLPTDPRGPIAESIIRMQKLANIKKER